MGYQTLICLISPFNNFSSDMGMVNLSGYKATSSKIAFMGVFLIMAFCIFIWLDFQNPLIMGVRLSLYWTVPILGVFVFVTLEIVSRNRFSDPILVSRSLECFYSVCCGYRSYSLALMRADVLYCFLVSRLWFCLMLVDIFLVSYLVEINLP